MYSKRIKDKAREKLKRNVNVSKQQDQLKTLELFKFKNRIMDSKILSTKKQQLTSTSNKGTLELMNVMNSRPNFHVKESKENNNNKIQQERQ